jgi:pyruvate dehydrogenase E1 component beta subunit
VVDTPISEAAIIGAAVGAAMTGMRPVAEMQYGDFVFCGMDQVINQAAKMHYMSDGQVAVPMVLRLPVGASARGAQHSQSTEAYFMHTPGLKVLCPSNSYDAKGLLDPIMSVPEAAYEVPIGRLAVLREGHDLTILANMLMVYRALAAADMLAEEGISAEVIDMRCLAPLDMATLLHSVKKCNRVLIVEEDNLTGGWGAEVAARLGQEAFYHLDAPIMRVAAPDTPAPTAPILEAAYVPAVEQVIQAARLLMEGG